MEEAARDLLLAANIGEDRNPYTAYHRARDAAPVARVKHIGMDVVMVHDYEHAGAVLKDQDRFSARVNATLMAPLLGRTILGMDGMEHLTHRRLIASAFRPKAIAAWEESLIVPTAHALIDRFASAGTAELVRAFTWQLPVRVFAEVLGVPAIDHERWQRWAIALERASIDWEGGTASAAEIESYFAPLIAARRSEPTGDLISDLVTAELDGERLPDDVIHGFIRLLIPAGAATTYRLLGSTLLALLTTDRLDALREDRARIPDAIEETLRWEGPVQFAMREATKDDDLAGVTLAPGEFVFVALGAANRDPSVYEEPDAYEPGRDGPPPHKAFGDGVHRCLGEHLARLEATVALNILLDRLEDIRLVDDGDPHIFGYAFRSPNRVPVTFRAA